MCAKCRGFNGLNPERPYRACDHRAATGRLAHQDKMVDFIQAVLGFDETRRLIEQAYEDIRTHRAEVEF